MCQYRIYPRGSSVGIHRLFCGCWDVPLLLKWIGSSGENGYPLSWKFVSVSDNKYGKDSRIYHLFWKHFGLTRSLESLRGSSWIPQLMLQTNNLLGTETYAKFSLFRLEGSTYGNFGVWISPHCIVFRGAELMVDGDTARKTREPKN